MIKILDRIYQLLLLFLIIIIIVDIIHPYIQNIMLLILFFIIIVLYEILHFLQPNLKMDKIDNAIYKVDIKNNSCYDKKIEITINLPDKVEYIYANPIPDVAVKGCWRLKWEKFQVSKNSSKSIFLKVNIDGKNSCVFTAKNIEIKDELIDVKLTLHDAPYMEKEQVKRNESLISRNTHLLLFLIPIIFFSFFIMLYNQPPQLMLTPTIISNNMSTNEFLIETISIKNVGSELIDLKFNLIGTAQLTYYPDQKNKILEMSIYNISDNINMINKTNQMLKDKNLINTYNTSIQLINSKKNITQNKWAYTDNISILQLKLNELKENISIFEDDLNKKELSPQLINIKNNLSLVSKNISQIERIIDSKKNISFTIVENISNNMTLNKDDVLFFHIQVDSSDVPGTFRGELRVTAKVNSLFYNEVTESIPIEIVVKKS